MYLYAMNKFKNIVQVLGYISTLLIIFGGISLATLVNNTKVVWKLPERVIILEKECEQIHHHQDVIEMQWELMRLMTDNNDSIDFYQFADDIGTVFEVDIRWTALPELYKLAFVGQPMFIVYPIHIGPNGRMYIMLHDSEEQNTYLYKKE